jgi:IS1 family transposase
MYWIWAVRHLYVREGYDCGDKACAGYGAYISYHNGHCVVRCRGGKDGDNEGCNGVNYTPYPEADLMKGSVDKNLVYLACLVWGYPCISSRHESGLTPRRATFINRKFARLCGCHNAREFVLRYGTLVNVQADETAIGNRKYNRGKRVRKRGVVWVAGCVEVGPNGSSRLFCNVVLDRKAESLAAVMKPLLRTGAVFTTDSWRAYQKMIADRDDVEHRQVNHTKEFVTKDGDHTNHIESMWRVLKKELRSRFSRCGVNDLSFQDDRVQFAAWIINERLGESDESLLQAAVRLYVDADETKPEIAVAKEENAFPLDEIENDDGIVGDGLPEAGPEPETPNAPRANIVDEEHSDEEEAPQPQKRGRGRPPGKKAAQDAAKRDAAPKAALKKTAK